MKSFQHMTMPYNNGMLKEGKTSRKLLAKEVRYWALKSIKRETESIGINIYINECSTHKIETSVDRIMQGIMKGLDGVLFTEKKIVSQVFLTIKQSDSPSISMAIKQI